MKKYIKIISFLFLSLVLSNCDEYNAANEVSLPKTYGFVKVTDVIEVDPVAPTYQLQVSSTTVSDVDRVVNIVLNTTLSTAMSGDCTYNTSITIPAGSLVGSTPVNFNFTNLPTGEQRKLVFDIVLPDDGSISDITKKTTTIKYTPLCIYNEVSLNIVFDDYPEETAWQLKKSGVLIAQSVYGNYAGLTTFSKKFCLQSGSYTFIMKDKYGDGMWDGTHQGTYELKFGSIILANAVFSTGATKTTNFVIP